MKICTKCKLNKDNSCFAKSKRDKDGLQDNCKDCNKLYRKLNSTKIARDMKIYQLENKAKMNKQRENFHINNPWIRTYRSIKQRCENKNFIYYKNYGGRGIRVLMNLEEVKALWFRDKAHLMKRPSIDRINNDGDYTLENCRFIELSEQTGKDKRKPILQFTLDGVFIKEFESLIKTEHKLKFDRHTISECCLGKRDSYKGQIGRAHV